MRYVQGLIPQFLTPDRKRLAFTSVGAGTGFDIFTVPVESDGAGLRAGKPEVFRKRRLTDAPLLFARRGWIAYDSNESGRTQIYVGCARSRSRGTHRWSCRSMGTDPRRLVLSSPVIRHYRRNQQSNVFTNKED